MNYNLSYRSLANLDICFCDGLNCPLSGGCVRYAAHMAILKTKSKELDLHSYFLDPPVSISDSKIDCPYFMDLEHYLNY